MKTFLFIIFFASYTDISQSYLKAVTENLKLTYYTKKGLGEPIRWILAYCGIPFEEYRFGPEIWHLVRPLAPFGYVPYLEFKNKKKKVHQSVAISRFYGEICKIHGENFKEDINIDMMVESLLDLIEEISYWYNEKEERLKVLLEKTLREKTVPLFLKRFNVEIRRNEGHVANLKFSWGDIYFASVIEYINSMLGFDIREDYPYINTLYNNVFSIADIAKCANKTIDPYAY